ncbi:sensor domain-containing protein [Paenibacillus sp. Root444D2]|uniref:sensor domain-containing protein n=1 Tax=Paenibacillus sp. Root444D2 TaxID=1736538 RepID=UPI0007C83C1D|nr:sensor domain-containing protein [Paenibacillus sp. Root444D2]
MDTIQIIRKHLRNFCFLLLTFVTGFFYFCFYLVGITMGVTMAFTLVGLPILHYVLRSTRALVEHERIQTECYTDISIGPVPSRIRTEGSLWDQVKAELSEARNWRAIFGLMLIFVIGLVSVICASLFYVTPIILLLAPILSVFNLLDYFSFLGMEIRTFSDSLYVMLAGAILIWFGPYLGNGLVTMIGSHTRRLVEGFTGK